MSVEAPARDFLSVLSRVVELLKGTIPDRGQYTLPEWAALEEAGLDVRRECRGLMAELFPYLRRWMRDGLAGELFAEAWKEVDELEGRLTALLATAGPEAFVAKEVAQDGTETPRIVIATNTLLPLRELAADLTRRAGRLQRFRDAWKGGAAITHAGTALREVADHFRPKGNPPAGRKGGCASRPAAANKGKAASDQLDPVAVGYAVIAQARASGKRLTQTALARRMSVSRTQLRDAKKYLQVRELAAEQLEMKFGTRKKPKWQRPTGEKADGRVEVPDHRGGCDADDEV